MVKDSVGKVTVQIRWWIPYKIIMVCVLDKIRVTCMPWKNPLLQFYSIVQKIPMKLTTRSCPRTTTSWCKYQSDIFTGKQTYKVKINIPKAIHDVLKPIFSYKDLVSDTLCLDSETQNVNEAFNGLIWKWCPKDVFVGRTVLEMGVSSAILAYNGGIMAF